MKTDSIFYRLFQEFPDIFFELIGVSLENTEYYQFSSVEIKQTAFRIDGVFLPVQNEEKHIYFVEVQFQTDDDFYSRLFAEICLYLRQNRPPNDWRAVVLYPNRSVDTQDIKHYREFFDSQRVQCIYLDELGDVASLPIGIATIKLVVADTNTAIVEATELITRTKLELTSQRQQQQLLQLIETILIYKLPNMSRKEIQNMFGLSDLKQTRFYQEAFQEGKEEGRQEGMAEGRQEGRQEGKEEGQRQEKLRMVSRLLRLGLTVEQVAAELELSIEEVQQAAQN
ncbi:flagellar assembly protein H [Nostoc piscinale CENA21]|uniref:Flagellar assembly protein H n=1 Tax=Nostoc piscinale CENA21 TaxID=224013 RepID=A0A0M4TUA3_9NOSO|nr:Rpn family recombination-promoting nuclease/putative transposase [Nostoc piscinale]ALF53131.1 flagellar assembly protein H [Nostoc piscinale CENA21]